MMTIGAEHEIIQIGLLLILHPAVAQYTTTRPHLKMTGGIARESESESAILAPRTSRGSDGP